MGVGYQKGQLVGDRSSLLPFLASFAVDVISRSSKSGCGMGDGGLSVKALFHDVQLKSHNAASPFLSGQFSHALFLQHQVT